MLGSDTGMDLSGFDVDSVVRPAFFASSAANVERTEVMINWDEEEAASLSATSAAIAAADFLVATSDFAFESVAKVDAFCTKLSSSSRFRMLLASSTCASATFILVMRCISK